MSIASVKEFFDNVVPSAKTTIGVAVTAGALYFSGWLAAIITAGSYYYATKDETQAQVSQPQVDATTTPTNSGLCERLSNCFSSCRKQNTTVQTDTDTSAQTDNVVRQEVDPRLQLAALPPKQGGQLAPLNLIGIKLPVQDGSPPKTTAKDDSRYSAALLQALFLNEPVLMQELPSAIGSRWIEDAIVTDNADAMLDPTLMADDKRKALHDLCTVFRANQPLTQAHLSSVRASLRILGNGGFPVGINKQKANELIALLDLYDVVKDANPNTTINGDRINQFGASIKAVDPTIDVKDSYKVFSTFANLILEGTTHKQDLTTTRTLQTKGNPNTLRADQGKDGVVTSSEKNCGFFELAVPAQGSLKDTLIDRLTPKKPEAAKYFNTDNGLTKFAVKKEIRQLQHAPEFLVLRNTSDIWPIVEDYIELDKKFFRDGNEGCYELCGVVRGVGAVPALVKRASTKACFLCRENQNVTLIPIDGFNEMARKNGSVFVYRKVAKRDEDSCVMM